MSSPGSSRTAPISKASPARREVIDAGVKGLIADVEPYSGFCNQNCAMLAEQFWKPSAPSAPTHPRRHL
jgi:hypothetical protein